MDERMHFQTKLWQRSQNSYATTIPREILLIKNAPTGDDAVVTWSINPDTGNVELKFEKDESE